MMGLRMISGPYFWKHRLRWLLTVTGVALGVAVLVAMQSANATVLNSFKRTVDVIAGETQLQVFGSDAGFSEDILEVVESCPDVKIAVPVIEQSIETDMPGQGNLLILGVDMLRDGMLRKYDFGESGGDIAEDILAFLAQPNALVVTEEFASQNHLSVTSQLTLRTAEGLKSFTIRGILRPGGLARAFGGNVAIMDIYAAQQMFGRGRVLDRIDLTAIPKVKINDVQARLSQMLGPGFRVDYPAVRAQNVDALLQVYSRMMDLLSVLALIVGVFIIYNSFSIAVTQRRAEIGILRAVGASRGQIRGVFLGEGALIGVVASGLGVAGGILLGQVSLKYISKLLEARYAVSTRMEAITIDPLIIAGAVVVGVIASVVAALLPAQAAASTDPILALQPGRYQVFSSKDTRIRNGCGAAVAMAAFFSLLAGRNSTAFYLSYVLSIIAAILFTPTLVAAISELFRFAGRRFRPVEVMLSTESLLQAPRRTLSTVGALMLSVAAVVAVGGVSSATYVSIKSWLSTTLNPDLLVASSENMGSHSFLFPNAMERELKAISGINDVQGVRTVRITVMGGTRTLIATDLRRLFHHSRPEFVLGTMERAQKLAVEGRGVIISENFAALQNIHLDEPLQIPTPTGFLTVPVVGIIRDFTSQEGSLFLDDSLFQERWNSTERDLFRVYLAPSVSADDIKRAILTKLGDQRRLFVLTNREVKQYVFHIVDQWFDLTYVQIITAFAVAILGIANSMFVSVIDRKRELAVLRAIGALPGQIKRLIYSEALLIAFIGLITGTSVGAVNLYFTLELCRRGITGISLSYEFPWLLTLILVPTICAAALLSAIWPGHTAVGASLVSCLEYE